MHLIRKAQHLAHLSTQLYTPMLAGPDQRSPRGMSYQLVPHTELQTARPQESTPSCSQTSGSAFSDLKCTYSLRQIVKSQKLSDMS